MRGLKDFTDEECGHTDQAWERSEALVVMIGVGLNMASKMGPNVRCRSLMYCIWKIHTEEGKTRLADTDQHLAVYGRVGVGGKKSPKKQKKQKV